MELVNSYQANNQATLASTNYNRAFDIALHINSIPLQSEIYHCFAQMYSNLGNNEDAKEQLKTSLVLDQENNFGEGMVRDYYDLARLTDEKYFIDRTIQLSDSLHLYKYILRAKNLMFVYLYVDEKNMDKALNYLESEKDLKQSYMNTGVANYYEAIGNIFFYSQKVDSALHYFKLAEYDYLKNYDQNLTRDLFGQIAQ
jgi:tetratricopeptide (TPR) repeat protein